ncbi:MAG: DUF3667 domain-containing protein [Bacteroidota bacterium]
MECLNCNAGLPQGANYCPSCGAKVVRDRLTLKTVWSDLSLQVFNLDNTFLRTFRHMFSQPVQVVLSYIKGTRKRYINPVGYFAVAVTLSGFMLFILRDVYSLNLTQSSFAEQDSPDLGFMFDYQGFVSYLVMPVYAFMTWLLFKGKNTFNYTEHLVANAYIFGQTSFIQVATYLVVLGLFPIKFDIFNFGYLLFVLVYQFWILGRMHKASFWGSFWRGFVYMVFLLILMGIIGTVAITIVLLTGQASLEDFRPNP